MIKSKFFRIQLLIIFVSVSVQITSQDYNNNFVDYSDKNIPTNQNSLENLDNSTSSTLSGSWGGIRSDLYSKGIDINFIYKGDVLYNINKGNESKAFYLDNFDLKFDLDFNQLFNWDAEFSAYIIGNNGGGIGEVSGSAQGISNIEAYNTWKMYELWLDQKFIDQQLSIRFGLYDLNSEFDTRETSSIFINPSHGIGMDFSQSGINGPSIFPNTSLALRIKYEPSEKFYFQTAVFDGVPGNINNPNGTHVKLNKEEGILSSTEIGFVQSEEGSKQSYGKYAIGFWFYSTKSENIFSSYNDPSTPDESMNYGIYTSFEKFLLPESVDREQGLSAFLRAGMANQIVNRFNAYIGGGISYKGIFAGRDNDIAGIAAAVAHTGKNYGEYMSVNENTDLKQYEINIEATYCFEVNAWLVIQPDFQWIINPIYSLSGNNTYVFGSRFEVKF